ncbi:N-lysine methyltransferase KMT5A isoform X2 [Eleutherodactylus coqui]|uniref:N-lysine methyltransferase KMT5A isoform X2 n=1 Tax=Eleutherodactylus coqui TaxID=57060 RepID=UPI00346329D0
MGRGKKMSKPSDGRSGDAPETCPPGGTNENKPKMNGDVRNGGQAKIYSYMSPPKSASTRPPLQEENSAIHNEGKYLGKASVDVHKKADVENIKAAATTELAKAIERKRNGCNSTEAIPDQEQLVHETQKKSLLPLADKTSGPQKMVKAKSNRRKVQETKSPANRKVTDYFPVRRSCRKSKKELQIEEKKRIDDLILSGTEEGMKIDIITDKGRGVIATRNFQRGEFVVEYHGDLIETTDAKRREALYAQDSSTGCYMYYFQYLNKTYCVDATKETNRLGRLINHSKNGNCHTKLHDINNVPHLILIASRDIKAGEELLYDYGDRSKSSIEAHPWLKS